MSRFSVGVDLGGTQIKAAIVEQNAGILAELEVDTNAEEGPEAVINRIAHLIQQLTPHAPDGKIAGVGIGAPGAVNWERDTVSQTPNLPGWEVVNLRDALRHLIAPDLTVIVENDANVAGLGSAHYGAGKPYDSFIMVTLGTGVGGAIIYRNRIFRGTTGGAGEIGHMTIDYEGPVDRTGVSGAIEAYLGQRFLSRHARYQLLTREDSILHKMCTEDLMDITPKLVFEAAQLGDRGAREVLAWAGHKLGCVLGSAVNLLDIRKIIVGGGVSAAGDFILEPARHAMKRFVMPGLRDGLEIIRETLGNEVGKLGAAHLVFEYLDESSLSPSRIS